jgi:putative oxidoreductase
LNFLDRLQPLGLLVLRLVLGSVMTVHGYHKVFGGMQHFEQMLHGMGIPPWMAYLVAAAEFGGGILVLLGFLTRFAALAILIDMTVAILKVHLHNGLTGQGGYEFPLGMAAIALALVCFGAGPIAVDAVWGGRRR